MRGHPEEYLTVEDAELCLQRFGPPHAPPLVLVGGAAASMDWWPDGLCGRLADAGRLVVRYDHRDTGRSTTGRAGHPSYDAATLDRDCEHLVEHLAVTERRGPVHLLGVSMGGGIAQAVALRRPDLVRTVTLVATSPVGGVPGLPGPSPRLAVDEPVPDPDWSDLDSVHEWSLHQQRPYAGALGVDERHVREVVTRVLGRSRDPAAAANHWLALSAGDEAAPLDVHDIRVPTLVVHGSDDPLFPLPHGRALAEAVPGARLEVVTGMGHEVPPAATWDQVVAAVVWHTS